MRLETTNIGGQFAERVRLGNRAIPILILRIASVLRQNRLDSCTIDIRSNAAVVHILSS
jgi:hypothetical protein